MKFYFTKIANYAPNKNYKINSIMNSITINLQKQIGTR
jgi:hypothetical protein